MLDNFKTRILQIFGDKDSNALVIFGYENDVNHRELRRPNASVDATVRRFAARFLSGRMDGVI